LSVTYVPGDAASDMFGGNSNWRGPIWMPMNFLIIESLRRFHSYYGDDFRIECPVGSGTMLHLGEIAEEISQRLCRIFLRNDEGYRPVFGDSPTEQNDPQFRDHVLFYEYFHGENGHGLGAAHQTGWTALVALLLRSFARPVAAEAPSIVRLPEAALSER
jgi:hypothetical protein